MNVLNVNEVIARVKELHGQYIHVNGILHPEFEGTCIIHYPLGETTTDHYNSSIYISPAMNFDFDENVFKKWSGKRVVAGGTVYGPAEHLGGCGHMSLWSSEMSLTQIDLYSKHFVDR